jgi:two-component system, NtrC family, sensor kinase
MGRDTKAVGKLVKKRRPKGATAKPRSAPKAERGRSSSGANRESKVARLTRELGEALQRQAATADVLKVIASSPTDTQPVFEAIVLTAVRLLRCDMSFVMLCDPPAYWVAAAATPEGLFDKLTLIKQPIDPSANFPSRTIVEKRALYLPDWSLIDLPEHERHIHETVGVNSALYLPLMREGECIGLLTLGGKQANIFGEREIALAESFRDQALIAIENARLFNEVQAKTRDLSESLQQQTATADVLKVISRSAFDLKTVLDTLVESAARLCEAEMAFIHRREGEQYRAAATFGFAPEFWAFMQGHPITPGRGSIAGRVALERHAIQIADVAVDPEYTLSQATSLARQHTTLGVPLLREKELIGVIVLARQRVELFTERQIALVTTFADQAVIAIENARLFDEVQARTRELSESLQFQTASAEVLKVISRSPDMLQPVLDVIVETSRELCSALTSVIFLLRDGKFHDVAESSEKPDYIEALRANPIPLNQVGSVLARAAREKRTIHVPNTAQDPESGLGGPWIREGPDRFCQYP